VPAEPVVLEVVVSPLPPAPVVALVLVLVLVPVLAPELVSPEVPPPPVPVDDVEPWPVVGNGSVDSLPLQAASAPEEPANSRGTMTCAKKLPK
jgi:hypothetical protein